MKLVPEEFNVVTDDKRIRFKLLEGHKTLLRVSIKYVYRSPNVKPGQELGLFVHLSNNMGEKGYLHLCCSLV